jgi:hypothetical protein
MSLFLPARFASSLDFTSRRLDFTAYATAPLTLLAALTAVWLRVQLTSWLCSDRPRSVPTALLRRVATLTERFHYSSKVPISAYETDTSAVDGIQGAYHTYLALAPWCPSLSLRV